jgi:hypothetical protein
MSRHIKDTIILKWIFKKWDGGVRTGLISLKTGRGGKRSNGGESSVENEERGREWRK